MVVTKGLFYQTRNSELKEIPSWAKYYISLGQFCADIPQDTGRVIIALAIPARAYASVLTAFGFVCRNTKCAIGKGTVEEHFSMICALPSGSALAWKDGNKLKDVKFLGQETTELGDKVKIQVTKETRKGTYSAYYLDKKQAYNLEISQLEELELPEKQKGKLIAHHTPFIDTILEGTSVEQFTTNTRLECSLIGFKSQLAYESQSVVANRLPSGYYSYGTISDILRIRNIQASNLAFRTEIVTTRRKRPPKSDKGTPLLAIFDGAAGFLEWRDAWPESHWLILLDRSDVNWFDEAVSLINDMCRNRDRRFKTQLLADLSESIPDGVEVTAFVEGKR